MKINELKTALSDRANEISATLAQKNNLGVIAEVCVLAFLFVLTLLAFFRPSKM